MRRKVAAICASAAALAWGGSVLADDTSHAGQESQHQQQGAQQSQQQESQRQQQGAQQHPQGAERQGAQAGQQEEAEESSAGMQQSSEEGTSASAASADTIKAAQQELKEKGFYDGKVDGIAGPKTQAAVSEFQRQNGLSESGQLNEETLAAMDIDESEIQRVSGSDAPSGMSQHGTMGQQGGATRGMGTGEGATQTAAGTDAVQLSALGEQQVRELQQKLQDHGLYKGEIDGVVGPQTRGALQQFYTKQAQLAGRGLISEQAANTFGIDIGAAQPVRGTEQPGTTQPGGFQGSQQGTQQRQQQQPGSSGRMPSTESEQMTPPSGQPQSPSGQPQSPSGQPQSPSEQPQSPSGEPQSPSGQPQQPQQGTTPSGEQRIPEETPDQP